MIAVDGLVKRYGSFTAVRGVSFEVRRGEVLGFLGPNGAGKTTTMRMLTGYTSAKLDNHCTHAIVGHQVKWCMVT